MQDKKNDSDENMEFESEKSDSNKKPLSTLMSKSDFNFKQTSISKPSR